MLEVLYRIYEVADEETKKANREKIREWAFACSTSRVENIELLMDCLICDSREKFKEIIKEEYGKDIRFNYSKKLKPGDLYCIIIGEHCYNTERYFNKINFTCDYCNTKIETYYKHPICFNDYEVKHKLYNIEKYRKKRFCCYDCKQKFLEETRMKISPDDDQEFYIEKDMFTQDVSGYIYKITKKSTGEFYVGQTIYAPIWRWGQHLKTERFPIEKITDYKFEVLEIVPKGENILVREKFYIQKFYKENPKKSLNIMCTANVEDDSQMNFFKE